MLDIEVLGSVAAGVKIVVYFAPNTARLAGRSRAGAHDRRRAVG
jgi:hypothetical protein